MRSSAGLPLSALMTSGDGQNALRLRAASIAGKVSSELHLRRCADANRARLHIPLSSSVDARANIATGNALKALQFEEKMMSERLAELRSLIEELKKK